MAGKDTPEQQRRSEERRREERRRQSAPVFMDTRAPGDRRAGERRGQDDGTAPAESGNGRGGDNG